MSREGEKLAGCSSAKQLQEKSSGVMTLLDAFPDASPDVSWEKDEPIQGTSGEELVNGSEQPSERELAQAQLNQDSQ